MRYLACARNRDTRSKDEKTYIVPVTKEPPLKKERRT